MSTTNPQGKPIEGVQATRRWRDVAVLAGLFGLMLVGLIAVAAATGWEEVKIQLSKLSWSEVSILLLLSLVNYVFRGLRWHLFARRLGLPTGLVANLRHFLGGFAMSVTPGRLGELIRMRWIRRETNWAFEKSAPLMLVDRASDLAAMAVLLAMSVAFSATGIKGSVPVVIITLAAAVASTRPAILSWGTTLLYRMLGFWPRVFARLRAAARSISVFSHPAVLLSGLVLGSIGWAAEGAAFYLLLDWMGADVGLWTAIGIFTFATIAGGVTGAPGGLGGAEAAIIGLLLLEGVPLEISLPATAIIRVTTLWFAIGIGLAIFPIAERLSLKVQNGLEN